MVLKKVIYYGEDERREISIKQAVDLLGEETVREAFLGGKTVEKYVDADYRIRFQFGRG